MIAEAQREHRDAEAGSFSVRGAVARRRMGSTEFSAELGQFLYFLQQGAKPYGMSDKNWRLYRIVTEELVSKKELKPEILGMFEEPSDGGV